MPIFLQFWYSIDTGAVVQERLELEGGWICRWPRFRRKGRSETAKQTGRGGQDRSTFKYLIEQRLTKNFMTMTQQPPPEHAPRAVELEINGLTFSGRFDSGNLKDVTINEDGEFKVWNLADCEGTVHATTYRTWFHFSVHGPRIRPGALLTFNVANMNKQTGLYSKGFRPVSFPFHALQYTTPQRTRHCTVASTGRYQPRRRSLHLHASAPPNLGSDSS